MKALAAIVIIVAVCALSVGCRAHVVIEEPPSSTAAVAERAAAFEKWKPRQLVDPGYRVASLGTPALQLNGGAVVEDPIDLAALVAPASPTMQHAERARELEETSMWLRAGFTAVGVVSLAGMLGSGVLFNNDGQVDGWGHLVFTSSSLFGSIGGLVLGLPTMAMQLEREREVLLAFHTYETDLRKRLALVRTTHERTARWEDASTPPSLERPSASAASFDPVE